MCIGSGGTGNRLGADIAITFRNVVAVFDRSPTRRDRSLDFFVIRRTWRIKAWIAVLGGFLIGALPIGVFLLTTPYNIEWYFDIRFAIEGRPTLADWPFYVRVSGGFGLYGALAGFVFWLVVRFSPAALGPGRYATRKQRQSFTLRPAISVSLATIVVASVVAIPFIAEDRTCHNMRPKDRASRAPVVTFQMSNNADIWNGLVSTFEDYSRDNNWSYRAGTRETKSDILDYMKFEYVRGSYLSMCQEAGTAILVARLDALQATRGDDVEQSWIDAIAELSTDELPLTVNVFQPQGGDSFIEPTKKIVKILSEHWPDDIWFVDHFPQERIPPPDWLEPAFAKSTD